MTDREYRVYRARPDVIRRGDVRATLSRLGNTRPDLADGLQRILAGPPLAKPPGHAGNAEADYFCLDLPLSFIDDIIDELGLLEATLIESNAPSEEVEATGSLLDIWNRAQRLKREL